MLAASVAAAGLSLADPLDPTTPNASFTTSPGSPVTGQTVTFTSTSTPGLLGGPIQSEDWDLDNDGQFNDASGSQAERSFAAAGSYTVGLKVTDTNGATDVTTSTVVVQNRLPTAAFDFSPSSPSTLQQVTFTSTSTDPDGSIASVEWDLDNDGQYNDGNGSSASRTFQFAGTYTIGVRVTDNDGGTDTATRTVQVGNQPPVASFDYSPQSPNSGDQVSFNSTSSDPDGSIVAYAWDLDGDGQYDDATTAQPTKTFTTPGDHTVRLRVTDSDGASATTSEVVTVANRAPTASFDYSPASPTTGQQITFTSGSTDPDGTIASVAWDLDNDGQFNDGTGTQATKTFTTQGPHVVSLRATDNSGATDVASQTVQVGNASPTAAFDFSPASPTTGQQVTFTSSSSDSDGSIASYSWDLDGDGNFGDATTAQPTKTYATPGSRTVRLTVTDDSGASATVAKVVTVANRAPTASFNFSPTSPNTNEQITFTSTSTDPDGTISAYSWDLDGDNQFGDSTSASPDYSFSTSGNHTVRLRVTDSDGASATTSQVVTVANRPPAASFNFTPSSPKTGDPVTFTSSSTDPDGTIASYAWDLDGDGQYDDATGNQATKTFTTPGTKTVGLQVTDNNGASATTSVPVGVANRPPSPSFTTSPASPKTGDPVTFTSTSTDPDGTIAAYAWDVDGSGFTSGTGNSLQTAFTVPGPHTVKLQVTDNNGASAVATSTVQIANRPPVASFTISDTSPNSGEQVGFSSTSTDPDGTIAAYAWDVDGSGFTSGSGITLQTAFAVPGTHTIKLRVTDNNGATDTATNTLTVANRLPVASFTYLPATPESGEQITFTSTSSDPDGTIASYGWDLDGNSTFGDATGSSATKTFATPGTKSVGLRVTDNNGGVTTVTVPVDVANRPPVSSFTSSPATPSTGDQITFTQAATDPDGTIASYSWDLNGDGTYGDAAGSSAQTSFAVPGPHVVGLTVTDNSGASTAFTKSIDVGNRLPAAGFDFSPAAPKTAEAITFTSSSTDPENRIQSIGWDFNNDGDFSDANGTTVQRAFPLPGSYPVKVQVTDQDGGSAVATKTVTVANRPPTAGFDFAPAAPLTGDQVTFTSTSADPEGRIKSIAWDFNNDGNFTDATGPTAQNAFAVPGNYTVKVQVTDEDGAAPVVATKTVTVGNRQPTASVDHNPKNPTDTQTGTAITFTATYNDPENRVKTIAWSADGDDVFNDAVGSGTLTRTVKKPGPYTVKFKIDDQDGGTVTATDTVVIGNRPPRSSFVVLPATPTAGSQLTLASTATDPDTSLDQWLWDLNGDGTYGDAQGPSVVTSFPTAGTYTVGLKVIDSEDLSDVSTQSITVQAPPPPATAAPQQQTQTGTTFRLLSPFPVVRMAGRIKGTGTRLRLFAVLAPPGARVVVTCRGRSCPFRLSARSAAPQSANGQVRTATSVRIKQLEKRVLKKGVVITIFVTKANTIGKYVQFKFRKGRPPKRVDMCLMPGAQNKPVQCPS